MPEVTVDFKGRANDLVAAVGKADSKLDGLREKARGVKEAFGGWAGELGGQVLDAAIEKTVEVVGASFQRLTTQQGKAGDSARRVQASLAKVSGALKGGLDRALVAVLPTVEKITGFLAKHLPTAIDFLGGKFSQIGGFINQFLQTLQPVISFLASNPEVIKAFAITVGILGGAIGAVTLAQAAWNVVMALNPIGLIVIAIGAVVAAVVLLVKNWDTVKAKTAQLWESIQGAFSRGAARVKQAISDAMARVVGTVRDRTNQAVSFVAGLPGRAGAAIAGIVSALGNKAVEAGGRLVNALTTKGNDAVNWARNLPTRLVGGIGRLGGLLYSAGQDVVRGLIEGLNSMLGQVMAKAREIADAVGNAAKAALGIRSPSTVFKGIGANVGQGLVQGVDNHLPKIRDAARSMVGALDPGRIRLDDNIAFAGGSLPGRGGGAVNVFHVTVHAPVGSSPADVGRALKSYLDAWSKAGGR